jgi:predicted permease
MGQIRARPFLVIAEVSFATVLLISSALLIRTFISLRSVNPGFESRNVLTMQMSLTGTRFYKTFELDRLVRTRVQRISTLPGVVSASSACCIPLDTVWQLPFIISGKRLTGKFHGFAGWTFISPGYFDTFDIPLLRGRVFTESDNSNSPGVVIINQTMAKTFWPNGDPLNDRLLIGRGMRPDYDKDPVRQIVGIVGDIRDVSLNRPPRPAVYVPMAQQPDATNEINLQQLPIAWFVRTKGEPNGVGPDAERLLLDVSDRVPTAHFRSMEEVESESIARAHFSTWLMTVFGCAALALAAIGIYGTAAYYVQQRSHEIGIRMALGATQHSILSMVVLNGLKLALIGAFIGLTAALMLTRLLSNLLFGIGPNNAPMFVSATIFLIAVALVACYIPARSAARLDPMLALRHE